MDWILIVAVATAALSTWELVFGRALFGRAPWNLSQRGLRLYGACSLALSLVVIALAITHNSGYAFVTFAIGALALAATIHLVTSRKATV